MPTQRGGFEFAEVRPRLVTAYERGQLVPFIGVGMSRPHCATWPGLIAGLERAAGIPDQPPLDANTKSEDLIQRANRAVRKLRSGAPQEFEDALRASLFTGSASVPGQTEALAAFRWPLVLTTNYDDFFVEAFTRMFGPLGLAVVGRSSEDCQRVLTSLQTAGRSLLWAIQGHLAAPCAVPGHENDRRLAKELVIDHTEYRRVTHREPHFRRAFAEVFRHRSFLFLGSGLRENYLQELFGEVLELYGPSTYTHFAIMPRGQVDPGFMYSRFQIAVVEYEPGDHDVVPNRLGELRSTLEAMEAAPTSWSWGRASTQAHTATACRPDFEVVRGPLPSKRADGECLVVSAGGKLDSDYLFVSDALQGTLQAWCESSVPLTRTPPRHSPFVAEYVDKHAFAVRARREHEDTKDLLQVRNAALALFKVAAPRYRCVRMQLLASGGNDRDAPGEPRHSMRTFPARFAFVEMVCAWGEWRRSEPSLDCRLVLHVVDPSVYREIQSGRIDVLELLLCEDIRFWAEIIEGDVLVERRQFEKSRTTLLDAIVAELALSAQHWAFEVSPLTGIDETVGPTALSATHLGRSIRELGVVPGSTVHFSRLTPGKLGNSRQPG